MFKYPKTTKESPSPREGREGLANPPPPHPSGDSSVVTVEPVAQKKDTSPEALRELLEKNLKWSQIIYEQTRKINSKLFWKSVFGWVMFLLFVVVPTAFSVWYLPSLMRTLQSRYQPILSMLGAGGQTKPGALGSTEDILKLLPISEDQKALLKTMLQNK